MKTQFEDAKVGDKVYSLKFGWGEIVTIHSKIRLYPVIVKFGSSTNKEYTFEGLYVEADLTPDLYWDEIKFEIPEKPKKLVTKTITQYCNLYEDNIEALYTKSTTRLTMYKDKELCINNAMSSAIPRGAKVTIEYEVQE